MPTMPEGPETLLSVDGLRKSYGSTRALRGMTFDVQPGEFLGLLGPNGAGKTTLIRTICGRVRPDAGEVRFLGRRLNWRRDRDAIGLVPQDLAVYPDLSAEENMRVFGRLHGVTGRVLRGRIERALEWTGLADRRRSLVGGFSGGMKRRVNIACGVLHEPALVLLDEPTVGVDPQSREKIFDMIEELRGRGTTFVLTTHHLDEAEARCDRLVIVDHGSVIAEGDAASLIRGTVGAETRVQLRLRETPAAATTAALAEQGVHVNGDGRTVAAAMAEVVTDLPRLMLRLSDAGCHVEDVHVRPPTLQSVFMHLTGRELRE